MNDPKIITALRAIIAPGSTHLDVRLSRENIVALLADRDARQADMDVLQADAARYRWLRENGGDWGICEWDYREREWVRDGRSAGVIDAVVDAAMKEEA